MRRSFFLGNLRTRKQNKDSFKEEEALRVKKAEEEEALRVKEAEEEVVEEDKEQVEETNEIEITDDDKNEIV